jgi:hypothetical protein
MASLSLLHLQVRHGLAVVLMLAAIGAPSAAVAESLSPPESRFLEQPEAPPGPEAAGDSASDFSLSLVPPPPSLVPVPPPDPWDSGLEGLLLPVEAPPPPAALLGPPIAINPGRTGGAPAGGFKPEDLLIKPFGTFSSQQPGAIDPNVQLVGQSLRHPFPTAFLPLSKGSYYMVNTAYGGVEHSDSRYPGDSALYAGLGLGDPTRLLGFQAEFGVPSINDLDYGNTLDLKVSRDLWNGPDLRVGLGAGWLSAANSGYSALNQSTQYGVLTTAWRLKTPHLPYDRLLHLNVGLGAPSFGDITLSGRQLFTSVGIETSPHLGFSAGFNADGVLFNSTMRF